MKTFFGNCLVSALLVLAVTIPMAPTVLAQDAAPETTAEAPTKPRVSIITSHGAFVLELEPEKAPKTVENFLAYAGTDFYEGTIFHRVMKNFMIQGGGFTADMQKKPTRAPITNEADNGLKNDRGTVAMARTNDPHSATAQFFVNLVDNDYLNHTAKNARGWGYTVFGHVVEGMDVVDEIAKARTASKNGMQNVPMDPITIRKVVVEKGGQ